MVSSRLRSERSPIRSRSSSSANSWLSTSPARAGSWKDGRCSSSRRTSWASFTNSSKSSSTWSSFPWWSPPRSPPRACTWSPPPRPPLPPPPPPPPRPPARNLPPSPAARPLGQKPPLLPELQGRQVEGRDLGLDLAVDDQLLLLDQLVEILLEVLAEELVVLVLGYAPPVDLHGGLVSQKLRPMILKSDRAQAEQYPCSSMALRSRTSRSSRLLASISSVFS